MTEGPFDSPAERQASAGVFPSWLVALLVFFCTPVTGGLLAAFNWARVGRPGRAVGVLAASGVVSAIGVVAIIASETYGGIVYLPLMFVALALLFADQEKLRKLHPETTRLRAWPVIGAAGFLYVCSATSGTWMWILTGSPAVRPEWIPAAPCPDAVASVAAEKDVIATWPEVTGPAGGFRVRMPEPTQDLPGSLDVAGGAAAQHAFVANHLQHPVGSFQVLTTDFPAGSVGNEELAVSGLRQGLLDDRAAISDRRLRMYGHCGYQLHYETDVEGRQMHVVARAFMDHERSYLLLVYGGDASVATWADAWFDTFELAPDGAP